MANAVLDDFGLLHSRTKRTMFHTRQGLLEVRDAAFS